MTKIGLQRLVDEAINPILAHAGFRSRKLTWNRKRGRFVDAIDIQTGKGGRRGHEEFTINVGVFINEFHEAVWGKNRSAFVKDVDCAVRARIGEIHGGEYSSASKDKWWYLDGEDVYLLCRSQVTTALTDSALPFLERFRSMRDIVQFMSNQGGWLSRDPQTRLYLALGLREIGDIDGCRSILQAQSRRDGNGWSAHARRLLAMLPV